MGIHSSGYSGTTPTAGSTTGVLHKQSFVATEGQSAFTITAFTLTDNYILIIDDIPQTLSSRIGQNVILNVPQKEGARVVVYN